MPRSSSKSPIRREFSVEDLLRGAVKEVTDRRRWLARPWEFALEVIGPAALSEAAGRSVTDFTPEQMEFLSAYCDVKVPKLLLKTGRGGSKTFLSALGLATMSYCIPRFTGTVLAGSFEQGRILYHYFEQFSSSHEFSRSLDGDPTKTWTKLRGGGWVRVLTASEKQVKGPHPMLLDVDEACAADVEILQLAMGQRLGSTLSLLRVTSTPDKLFHIFRDWWQEADTQGWRTFEWGMRKMNPDGTWEPTLPWIPRETIEDVLATQDSNWVRIHVDGQFGSATGTVFRYEDVQQARIESLEADPLYNKEAVVSRNVGIDWGFEHPTVITVTEKVELSAELTGQVGVDIPKSLHYVVHVEGWTKKSADFLYGRILDVLRAWPADLFLDASHIFENEAVRKVALSEGRRSTPVPFNKYKMAMVGHTNLLLESKSLRVPKKFIETLDQLASYEWEETISKEGVQVRAEKPKKINDDYVDSLILSLWGHRRGKPGIVVVHR